jgi:putative endonuclease
MASPLAEGSAREAEARAALERAGLRLRAANVRYRVGELDLVMDDGEVLVFVEVRYRRSEGYGGGSGSVDGRKQQKLARAAALYLADHPSLARRPCRFDVVALGDGRAAEWIRDAFQLDGRWA